MEPREQAALGELPAPELQAPKGPVQFFQCSPGIAKKMVKVSPIQQPLSHPLMLGGCPGTAQHAVMLFWRQCLSH